MKTNKKVYLGLIIFVGGILIFPLSGRLIYLHYHKYVHSKPKMYAYQTYWGVVNPVLFVESKHNIDSLINYYQAIEKGDTNPVFNFPPLMLPTDSCVYVLDYVEDSLAAKVVSYYNWGKKGEFVKGYVYIKTLHKSPPINRN